MTNLLATHYTPRFFVGAVLPAITRGSAAKSDATSARYPQYSSLNYPNCLVDDHWLRRFGVTSSQRPVAHLSFDAAQIAPTAAASDALLQYLFEYVLMKDFPLHRGE